MSYEKAKSTRYLVETSFYDKYKPKILGIYVIDDDVPLKISEDVHRMGQIFSHIIRIRTESNKDSKIDNLLNINLFKRFSHIHFNYHTELRDLQLLIRENKTRPKVLYSRISEYLNKKNDYYIRQNNHEGISFCNDIKNTVLNPLYKLLNVNIDQIDLHDEKLSITNLKFVWNDFKKNNYHLVKKYFDHKANNLFPLDFDNTFEIKLSPNQYKGQRFYYLCVDLFGETWYLELFDDYDPNLLNIVLIEL